MLLRVYVKEVLVREQKGLCAYCMRRIYRDSHCKIEYLVPLSRDREKALDYHNLRGVCDGGEIILFSKKV